MASLLVDKSGNIFGMCAYGPVYENGAYGELYEIQKGSSTISPMAEFTGPNGSSPVGNLILDGAGNVFGVTEYGGPGWITGGSTPGDSQGTYFEIGNGSGTITTLTNFTSSQGGVPVGGLVQDGEGNSYGATTSGGPYGYGMVYEIPAGTTTIKPLDSFGLHNLELLPKGPLALDSHGNLFGATSGGGSAGLGGIYEIAQGSNTISTLVSFTDTANGNFPAAGLVCDGQGDLFGLTSRGGQFGSGTIFEIPAGSNNLTTLVNIPASPGTGAALIIDAAGNLFGTTSATVFEFPVGGSSLQTLGTFASSTVVAPTLVAGPDGNLYGYSTNELGSVFEVTGSGFVVPEPGSISLVAVMGAFVGLRRRPRRL
jgi:uncharacterized repeat protein (TIGR03803 family)